MCRCMLRAPLIALQFLTRAPMPWIKADEAEIGAASGFFPLAGAAIGAAAAALYFGASRILPHGISVIIVLIFTAAITGAIHEDGLADSLDGFGGGWTREAVLSIMKDSRIGTFGTLGLIFLVLSKYSFLSLVNPSALWRWLVFAHTASRWSMLPLCVGLKYAREQGQGKLVARRISISGAAIGTITLVAASLLFPFRVAGLALLVSAGVTTVTGLYYRRRLGGITGDCLGATNQLVEVAAYLLAVILAAHP